MTGTAAFFVAFWLLAIAGIGISTVGLWPLVYYVVDSISRFFGRIGERLWRAS